MSFEEQIDAGTFYLQKLGIVKGKGERKRLQGEVDFSFRVDYFNQRNLTFEPLIEPWKLFVKVEQQFQCGVKLFTFSSDHMLNLNLTYGMSLTLR
mmetsp:Transcript_8999/g.8380  ORF Transcript_8999/g.8380 Transcript_8999/m.8380 type:complete len:95 (-) Transcript_8999:3568-3852(-)